MADEPVKTVCQDDCEAMLPVVDYKSCKPQLNLSEIRRIFIGKATAKPFEDWKLPAEWMQRVSESKDEADTLRPLTVIADKPAPDETIVDVSDGRKVTLKKTMTVNYTSDDTNQTNYEFFTAIECGGQFRIWLETKGGKMYGGNEGILLSGITASPVNERGNDAYERIEGAFTWDGMSAFPARITSPISTVRFDATNGQ